VLTTKTKNPINTVNQHRNHLLYRRQTMALLRLQVLAIMVHMLTSMVRSETKHNLSQSIVSFPFNQKWKLLLMKSSMKQSLLKTLAHP
jgi:hypothetical protein